MSMATLCGSAPAPALFVRFDRWSAAAVWGDIALPIAQRCGERPLPGCGEEPGGARREGTPGATRAPGVAYLASIDFAAKAPTAGRQLQVEFRLGPTIPTASDRQALALRHVDRFHSRPWTAAAVPSKSLPATPAITRTSCSTSIAVATRLRSGQPSPTTRTATQTSSAHKRRRTATTRRHRRSRT